jgi:hypothetical protein
MRPGNQWTVTSNIPVAGGREGLPLGPVLADLGALGRCPQGVSQEVRQPVQLAITASTPERIPVARRYTRPHPLKLLLTSRSRERQQIEISKDADEEPPDDRNVVERG